MRIRGRAAIATWLDLLLIIAVASLPLIIYIIIIDGGELQDVLEMLMGFSIILLVTTPILAVALITVIISPLFTEMYATLKDGVLKQSTVNMKKRPFSIPSQNRTRMTENDVDDDIL